jgi:hypothetical protein
MWAMSTLDKSLQLARGVIPTVAMLVFVLVRFGTGFGLMIVPFVAVLVIGIVQAVRRSGLIERRTVRGSLADSAAQGRARADEILGQRD